MAERSDVADDGELLCDAAALVLREASRRSLTLATAESCTGGLLASLLTDIDGCSGAFDRGFVVYSNQAKCDMLGIDPGLLRRHGAVSEQIAEAMARGALERSDAGLVAAITGFAGPAGPRDEPGLVHIAVAARDGRIILRECHFGPRGREQVRFLAARGALEMLQEMLDG